MLQKMLFESAIFSGDLAVFMEVAKSALATI